MSSKKRTAVEWLAAVVSEMRYVSTDVLNQALEMEKQQTIDFAQTFAIKEASREFLENIYKETYED